MKRRARVTNGVLTESEVAQIKWNLQQGLSTPREIAQAYGVGTETIRRIDRGDTWAHVQALPPDQAQSAAPASEISEEEIEASKQRLLEKLQGDIGKVKRIDGELEELKNEDDDQFTRPNPYY